MGIQGLKGVLYGLKGIHKDQIGRFRATSRRGKVNEMETAVSCSAHGLSKS